MLPPTPSLRRGKLCSRGVCDVESKMCTVADSLLSRRDLRTKPGVLTPGVDQNKRPPRRGGRSRCLVEHWTNVISNHDLSPLQGESIIRRHPGVKTRLKPRAESCDPFGIKHLSTNSAPSRRRDHSGSGAYRKAIERRFHELILITARSRSTSSCSEKTRAASAYTSSGK